MATTREFTTSKGERVTSALTDHQAAEIIHRAADAGRRISDFAWSLAEQAYSKKGVSDNQRPWLHKLALELVTPPAPKPVAPDAPAPVNLLPLVQMMQTASKGLKNPKVTIELDGATLRLTVAGANARVPGSLNVTDGRPFGQNAWYGRIHQDGRLETAAACTPAIVEALKGWAMDPAGKAAIHGQRTGNCCFCSRELSTKESLSVGYGPICADKYGLPWGDISEPNDNLSLNEEAA